MFWDIGREGAIIPKPAYEKLLTLLRRLKWRTAFCLNRAHPKAHISLQQVIGDLGIKTPIDPERLKTKKVDKLVALYVELLDQFTSEQGAASWIEKTPTHVNYLNEIEKFISDAKFVHVIRNGADAVASLFDISLQYPDEMWTKRYNSIERCCERWCITARNSLAKVEDNRHLILRFEDIVKQYSECAKLIDLFLGHDPLRRKMNISDQGRQSFVKSSEPWKNQVFKEPTLPINKFQTIFTKNQQDEILKKTRPFQQQIDLLLPYRYIT